MSGRVNFVASVYSGFARLISQQTNVTFEHLLLKAHVTDFFAI